MNNAKPYTIVVLLNATPAWLSLSRNERSQYFADVVMPIFKRVASTVNVQLYDSEYFHAKVSDFMLVNTTNLNDYKLLIELLRDTKIYGEPYFNINDIIVGQHNLFEDFNQQLKNQSH